MGIKEWLDRIRPYGVVTGHSPWPKWTALQLGSVIHPSARVSGRLKMEEPSWFQMNRGAFCRNITIDGLYGVYLGEGASLVNARLSSHTLVLKDRVMSGMDCKPYQTSLSVDLEGCTPFYSPRSPKGREMQRQAAYCAGRIHAYFKYHGIKSTWYIVGRLFDDPHMGPVCEALTADCDVEIGWHTHSHLNYYASAPEEVLADLEKACRLREKTGIRLSAMAFPYNAVGHLALAMRAGFTKFRGYIGQYYLPATIRFGTIEFFGTSFYIGPHTDLSRLEKILNLKRNCNLFLHPVDWINHDMNRLFAAIDRMDL